MGHKAIKLFVGLAACCLCLSGQDFTQAELAGLLVGGHTAEVATFVAASPRDRMVLLLDLTKTSPPGVERQWLQIGLADVFGEMKAQESIPFLLDHLTLRRGDADFAPWSKIDPVVLTTFPCIQALVAIEAPASRALINRPAPRAGSEERLATIFVLTHIQGVPEAAVLLKGVAKPTMLEQYYIDGERKLPEH